MRNTRCILLILLVLLVLFLCLTACSSQIEQTEQAEHTEHTETVGGETSQEKTDMVENDLVMAEEIADLPTVLPGEKAALVSQYVDENGDIAIIPKDFTVSEQEGKHTVNTGVVVIGPDESEFVWVPTTQTTRPFRAFSLGESTTIRRFSG